MPLSLVDVAKMLRAFGSGIAGGVAGWPMDTAVGAANLARAGYGYGGSKLGLLKPEEMPELIENKNIPGTSEYISSQIGVGDSPEEQWAEIAGSMVAPGPKGKVKAPRSDLIVYHGSPHRFDKLDMSKIGSGEGGQAYGHGLYFAEHPDVAKEYKDILKWRGVDWDDPQVVAANTLESWIGKGDRANAATSLEQSLASNRKMWPDRDHKTLEDAIALLRSDAPITGKATNPGNLYKVDIPDEHVAKMLDWDKPLSQQPESVQKALSGVLPPVRPTQDLRAEYRSIQKEMDNISTMDPKYRQLDDQLSHLEREMRRSPDPSGAEIYKEIGRRVTGDYEDFSDNRRLQIEATKLLRDAGVPGVRYLDQGSRTKGVGTSNFVLFDDQLAKILGVE